MKKCTRCLETKPLVEFNFKNKKKNTRQHLCKPCQSLRYAEYYKDNKATAIATARRNNQKRADRFYELKELLECCVCGEDDSSCIDFHHMEGSDKKFLLSKDGQWCSEALLFEELAKCAALCANCHRKHHAGR